ncbi:uncharacterized protein METZ01_LOCUS237464, partial [marine metagenome]
VDRQQKVVCRYCYGTINYMFGDTLQLAISNNWQAN